MAGGRWSRGDCPEEQTTRSRTTGTLTSDGGSSGAESIQRLISQPNQPPPKKAIAAALWPPPQSTALRSHHSRHQSSNQINSRTERKSTSTSSSPSRFFRLHRSLLRNRSYGGLLRQMVPMRMQVLAWVAASWAMKIPINAKNAIIKTLIWLCKRKFDAEMIRYVVRI